MFHSAIPGGGWLKGHTGKIQTGIRGVVHLRIEEGEC